MVYMGERVAIDKELYAKLINRVKIYRNNVAGGREKKDAHKKVVQKRQAEKGCQGYAVMRSVRVGGRKKSQSSKQRNRSWTKEKKRAEKNESLSRNNTTQGHLRSDRKRGGVTESE